MAFDTAASGGTSGTSADAPHTLRMFRIGDLEDHRIEHGQVGAHRHAVVEEARVIELAVLVEDVFLAQRPTDPLGGAALDLAFDIARMDGTADVLKAV